VHALLSRYKGWSNKVSNLKIGSVYFAARMAAEKDGRKEINRVIPPVCR